MVYFLYIFQKVKATFHLSTSKKQIINVQQSFKTVTAANYKIKKKTFSFDMPTFLVLYSKLSR